MGEKDESSRNTVKQIPEVEGSDVRDFVVPDVDHASSRTGSPGRDRDRDSLVGHREVARGPYRVGPDPGGSVPHGASVWSRFRVSSVMGGPVVDESYHCRPHSPFRVLRSPFSPVSFLSSLTLFLDTYFTLFVSVVPLLLSSFGFYPWSRHSGVCGPPALVSRPPTVGVRPLRVSP